MAPADTDQEPSIEEILSSIRQIISDDDEQPAPAKPAAAPKPEPMPEPPAQDVIELTNKVEDDFASMVEAAEPVPPPIEVAMQEAAEDVLESLEEDFIGVSEPETAFEPEPEPLPPPPPPRPAAAPRPAPAPVDEDADSILTNRAEAAALRGFGELARKTAVEYNGITLEEIVRTELKPMLRDWLDRNLPPIIERLVQEELERVSKRALED